MNDTKVRRMEGERGASLILAIVFMVVIGAISAAVLATTTSGLQDRVVLDQARNREYAADGAIEIAITRRPQHTALRAQPAAMPPVTINQTAREDPRRLHLQPVVHRAPRQHDRDAEQHRLHRVRVLGLRQRRPVHCAANTIINAQVNFQGRARRARPSCSRGA